MHEFGSSVIRRFGDRGGGGGERVVFFFLFFWDSPRNFTIEPSEENCTCSPWPDLKKKGNSIDLRPETTSWTLLFKKPRKKI